MLRHWFWFLCCLQFLFSKQQAANNGYVTTCPELGLQPDSFPGSTNMLAINHVRIHCESGNEASLYSEHETFVVFGSIAMRLYFGSTLPQIALCMIQFATAVISETLHNNFGHNSDCVIFPGALFCSMPSTNCFAWLAEGQVSSILRWDGSHSAEVNENINLGYSQDQGYS